MKNTDEKKGTATPTKTNGKTAAPNGTKPAITAAAPQQFKTAPSLFKWLQDHAAACGRVAYKCDGCGFVKITTPKNVASLTDASGPHSGQTVCVACREGEDRRMPGDLEAWELERLLCAEEQRLQERQERREHLKEHASDLASILTTVYFALDSIGCDFSDLVICNNATVKDVGEWEAQQAKAAAHS